MLNNIRYHIYFLIDFCWCFMMSSEGNNQAVRETLPFHHAINTAGVRIFISLLLNYCYKDSWCHEKGVLSSRLSLKFEIVLVRYRTSCTIGQTRQLFSAQAWREPHTSSALFCFLKTNDIREKYLVHHVYYLFTYTY